MKAFILAGLESSGNHLFCTLFSKLRYKGEQLSGTDMCGWEDGKFKTHVEERFNPIWRGTTESIAKLADHKPLVTNQSVPCGNWPNLIGFFDQAVEEGYDPLMVPIVRDWDAVMKSAKRKDMGINLHRKWNYLMEQVRDRPHRYISYETLVMAKRDYLLTWLGEGFDIDEKWFEFIKT